MSSLRRTQDGAQKPGRRDNSCAAQDGAVPPPALLGPPTAPAVLPDTSGSGPPDERAPAAPRPRPLRARSLRLGRHLLAIVAFGIPGVVLWWHAWDGHLGSTLACACGDSGQTVWFVAWPAYALAHGLDPFFSSALHAPRGVNLLVNASSVPVGLVLAPLTWTAGPIVATNVALTLCPALSAWACWLACGQLVAWRPAAVLAGVLFGYSPFVVTNLALGHLGLALLVVPPLLLVATRHVLFGPGARRTRWGLATGALLVLQFFLSAEILAILVVVGVPCVVLALRAAPRPARAPSGELLRACAAALGVCAVVLAVPVWAFLAGPEHLRGPLWPGASIEGNVLDAWWNAGRYRSPGTTLLRFGGYEGLRGPPSSYLGPIVLALALASLLLAWRRRSAWVLTAGACIAAVLSFGILLRISPGHVSSVWLPWRALSRWPLLDDIIPQRFSAMTDLCVALLIGIGADRAVALGAGARGVRGAQWARGVRWVSRRHVVAGCTAVVSVAAVGSMWWTYQVPFTTRAVSLPRWYLVAAPEIRPGSVVLSYPFPFPLDGSSAPMVWQALDGMAFRLAGGYVKAPGPGGRPLSDRPPPEAYDVLARLTARAAGHLPAGTPHEVRAVRTAIARWHVDVVVVTIRGRDPARAVALFTKAVGRTARRELGAWVWDLPAGHPASGTVASSLPGRVERAPPTGRR